MVYLILQNCIKDIIPNIDKIYKKIKVVIIKQRISNNIYKYIRMNRFLLINNRQFFDENGVITIETPDDIPDKSSILFIGSHTGSMDNLHHIVKYFGDIEKKPYTYIIIVGKGDGRLKKDIKIPNNVKYIYAPNTDYKHDKIKFLPMGCDFRSIESFSKADEHDNQEILCYCNFSINTHPSRKRIYDGIKHRPCMTIENMQTWMNYSISRDDFFTKLGQSKFVLCPRGNGLDTFRFYDSIYAGSIPILVKEQYHDNDIFKEIPMLLLKDEKEFKNLNWDSLTKHYEKLKKLRKDKYDSFDFSKFIKGLHSKL